MSFLFGVENMNGFMLDNIVEVTVPVVAISNFGLLITHLSTARVSSNAMGTLSTVHLPDTAIATVTRGPY